MLIRRVPVSGNCVSVTLADPGRSRPDYYYVLVRRSDDGDGDGRNDEALSAPIWFD